MSVPQSPIPAQRKSPAPTVVESVPAKTAGQKKPAAAAPRPVEKKSNTSLIAAVVLLLLAGGGYGWYRFMGPGSKPDATQTATQTGTPVNVPQTTAPSPDSLLRVAIADSIAKVLRDSTTRADSIAKARDAAAAAALAAKNARVASNGSKGKTAPPSTTKTQDTKQAATDTRQATPAQQQEVQKAPAPLADGYVVIGTRTPGAILFINGTPRAEPLKSNETLTLRPGEVKLSIRAEKCTPIELTVTVVPKDTVTIGRKILTCGE
jgi:hypothetical protein